MIPTLEYIENKFHEFNELMFEGKLADLPFKLSSARTFLGQIRYIRDKMPDGTERYCGFQFVINTKIDLPEREIEDTIIHEMIHYYILSNQMQDTGPHGELFIQMMQKINLKFDRNVSVAHKVTKEEQDNDTEIREHLFCISKFRGNQLGITIANKSKILQLWDELPKVSRVEECKWYLSTDPYFNRYPRASSVKIYPIDKEVLEGHLKDAKLLVRIGYNIKIAK